MMKNKLVLATTLILGTTLFTAQAQPGPRGGGFGNNPRLGGAMIKLFGENKAFSATMEIQSHKESDGTDSSITGKVATSNGKTRFEMSLDNVKGGRANPQQMAQMKAMGLGEFVFISRPDLKVVYQVNPGLQAYADTPFNPQDDPSVADKAKMDVVEIGKEDFAGHPCVKNKVTLTAEDGKATESIVWNAQDLKNFPVKIEHDENGNKTAVVFKDVKLSATDAKLFEPPAGFEHYNSPQQMMQEAMMKKFGGPGGIPLPPQPK